MRLLVEFEIHEYMDMYPRKKVLVFGGIKVEDIIKKATDWADDMNITYSGGTTTFKRVLPHREAVEYISKEIDYTLENPINSEAEGGLDEADVRQLKYLSTLLQVMIAQEKILPTHL